MIPYEPSVSPTYNPPPPPPPVNHNDVNAAATRVLDAGVRPIIKDNYEQRMDVFAKEMNGQTREYQAELINEVLKRDDGAFQSWLHADRLDWMTRDGDITQTERTEVYTAFSEGIDRGLIDASKVDLNFVKDSHDPALIGQYMGAQNLDDRKGFENALTAFSGLPAGDIRSFVESSGNQAMMQKFEQSVQHHQDWYENLTADFVVPGEMPTIVEGKVEFSKDQLSAMREAFLLDDKLHTSGELLLAYPDRMERNERVTQQYFQLSNQMSDIVGKDNANWATFAQWASDEIGRNLDGGLGIALGDIGGDPKYWLSVGNSMLISDIGPSFQHFVDTFGGGKNRDMSFEQFWSSFESKHADSNLTYVGAGKDPELDMKNAFKAYYDAMHLKDGEAAITDPTKLAQSQDQRAQLMLYGNSLVGLQEQYIVDHEISEGMNALGDLGISAVNPWGAGHPWIDFHLPGQGGHGERRIDTDLDMPNSPTRVNFDQEFVTADGRKINLGDEMRTRLNGLDGNPNNEDETDPANSGTHHWEEYSQRMGTIYHLFANYQR
ncbi:MAG: hypothetical protein ACREP7_01900, partial [Lysobacter sp.]